YVYPFKARVMKFNGSNWENVGKPGFSAGQASYTSLALDPGGTPYVVYEDWSDVLHRATVMKYDGSSWVNVGSPAFSEDTVHNTQIVIDRSGIPYVLSIDEG